VGKDNKTIYSYQTESSWRANLLFVRKMVGDFTFLHNKGASGTPKIAAMCAGEEF
jgi:hypothetical protein